jgi:hypothetical protein
VAGGSVERRPPRAGPSFCKTTVGLSLSHKPLFHTVPSYNPAVRIARTSSARPGISLQCAPDATSRVSTTASVRCPETPWKHPEAKLVVEVIQ